MARETVRPRSVPLLRELMSTPRPNYPKGLSLRDMEGRGIGKSMIHALLSSNPKVRKETCSAELGVRISEVLGVPFSVLFAPVESTDRGRASKAAA